MKRGFLILIICWLCKACTSSPDTQTIKIYVAASLSPVIEEIAEIYKQQTGIQVLMNSASSGTLARQIAQGVAADLFISANQQWMAFLQKDEFIHDKSTLPVKNQLVLVAPLDGSQVIMDLSASGPINELLKTKRLAIGDPQHVPVGHYAMQAIQSLNWQLSPEQTLPAKDARATLMAVELGEADLGIVYRTDAEKSEKVSIIAALPKEAYAPIHYFAGTCSNNPLTAELLSFMNSPEAKQVWEKYGFIL